jgi:hypothetical protein
VNVDTGTFSAISAEAEMLRRHAGRAAPGRHRRPRRQRQPGEHAGPERGMDRWWRGGYAAAMAEVLIAMSEAVETADAAAGDGQGASGEQTRRAAAEAAYAVAEAAVELYNADTMPASWLDGQ